MLSKNIAEIEIYMPPSIEELQKKKDEQEDKPIIPTQQETDQ